MPDIIGQSISVYLRDYEARKISYGQLIDEIKGTMQFCYGKYFTLKRTSKLVQIIAIWECGKCTLANAVREIKGMME